VLGWARLLQKPELDAGLVPHAVEVIERNTVLQLRMVDDLLDTARIAAGKFRLDLKPIDLTPVAKAALEVVAPAAQAKGITIVPRFASDVGLVLADADRIQQVIWNLLSNAVKFTGRGGTIDFRLQAADTYTQLTIADNGSGIDPQLLPFIFERFRQGGGSGERASGLGLGLALAKDIVDLHGGKITAENGGERGGATFVVSLPALPRASGEAQGSAREVSARSQGTDPGDGAGGESAAKAVDASRRG
jgi:signal transduction histidine kinase